MTLQLWSHPLASFCHKVLIALAEKRIEFKSVLVDFGNPDSAAAFRKVWPMAKMPVLVDDDTGMTVGETTIILDYLEARFPESPRLLPMDLEGGLAARFWERFFDLYVELPMQKIVLDRLRPEGKGDAFGVEQAYAQLREAYGTIERQVADKTWVTGSDYTIGDCSASPALFYANTVEPIGSDCPAAKDYLERLMTRPSYARILREAEPYFGNFPMPRKPDISILDREVAR